MSNKLKQELRPGARKFITDHFVFLPWKDTENCSTTFGELEEMLIHFAASAILAARLIENADFLEVFQRYAPKEARLFGLQTISQIVGGLNELLTSKQTEPSSDRGAAVTGGASVPYDSSEELAWMITHDLQADGFFKPENSSYVAGRILRRLEDALKSESGAKARLVAIEEFGVLLADAEMDCAYKHVNTFNKLSAMRDATLKQLTPQLPAGDKRGRSS